MPSDLSPAPVGLWRRIWLVALPVALLAAGGYVIAAHELFGRAASAGGLWASVFMLALGLFLLWQDVIAPLRGRAR